MQIELHKKYWLSTEGFYFRYRNDKYNPDVLRADLFDDKHRRHESIRVKSDASTGIEMNLSHTDVINIFESMVSLSLSN